MENKNKKFNLFKTLQNIALIGLFLVIGFGTMFFLTSRNSVTIELTLILGFALLGVLLVLPWAKYMEQKEYKIVSIVFLVATAVCVVLWEISTIIIFAAYRSNNFSTGILQLVRITLVISLQLLISSFIGQFIIKYRAKYIPFQVIAYLSLVCIDFYVSTMLFGITIGNGDISYSDTVKNMLFFNPLVRNFLILALVYLSVTLGVIGGARKRRVRNAILASKRKLNQDIGLIDLDDDDEEETPTNKATETKPDAEAQLEKLKNMLDKGLITQDEYNTKRQAIIENM